MKETFINNNEEITIYTDAHIVKIIEKVYRLPDIAQVSIKIGEQPVSGSPAYITNLLQGILYQVCRREGFEGVNNYF